MEERSKYVSCQKNNAIRLRFDGTVVNGALPSLYEGSLEIALTVSVCERKSYYVPWFIFICISERKRVFEMGLPYTYMITRKLQNRKTISNILGPMLIKSHKLSLKVVFLFHSCLVITFLVQFSFNFTSG